MGAAGPPKKPSYDPTEEEARGSSSKHSRTLTSIPDSANSHSENSHKLSQGGEIFHPTFAREPDRVGSSLRDFGGGVVPLKFPTPPRSTSKATAASDGPDPESLASSERTRNSTRHHAVGTSSRPPLRTGVAPSEAPSHSSSTKRSLHSASSSHPSASASNSSAYSARLSIPRRLSELDVSLPPSLTQEKIERKHDEPPFGSERSSTASFGHSIDDIVKKAELHLGTSYGDKYFPHQAKPPRHGTEDTSGFVTPSAALHREPTLYSTDEDKYGFAAPSSIKKAQQAAYGAVDKPTSSGLLPHGGRLPRVGSPADDTGLGLSRHAAKASDGHLNNALASRVAYQVWRVSIVFSPFIRDAVNIAVLSRCQLYFANRKRGGCTLDKA